MGFLLGLTYCCLWYSSILAGYVVLFCPLLPLLLISNKNYRKMTDIVFAIWQTYPTALLEILCKCDIQITGDYVSSKETSLLIMNHRTRTDWNFLWPALHHAITGENNPSYPTKFVLKDSIRHIPGPGWVMQLACFTYLKRDWMIDKERIKNVLDYFIDLSYKFSMMIFPEGTDFTPKTKKLSDKYAEKNNLEKYDYVLHPRTTGFTYIASRLLKTNSLDAIYDVTIAYCDTIPQTELDILKGNFPKMIKIHFTRFPSDILPKTKDGLNSFLKERWESKERILKEFFNSGNFLHGKTLRYPHSDCVKYISLAFWGMMPGLATYLLMENHFYRHMVVSHTFFLVFLNVFGIGFQSVEINLYNLKKVFWGIFKMFH
nr:lysocardiolipin acyltransferase 1-like [Onthophagus taurus]